MVQVVIEGGGEGLVLRKPKSLYENGRSPFLLKIKVSKESGEDGGGRREEKRRVELILILSSGFTR